ncbi:MULTISPECIES: hypothetical protein [Pseudanabaena]|jgi:DNA-directed RNA polymerase specialized sigma subunit|uniref:hypothetical protein n=1 Tax=Pseudanabaena TaxID=1152 RepID=UPI0024795EAB|nr:MULTISPECIES: hypothetical protein [Pseudanabaena]MEA5487610.1 hypothetical protein [Pseudanabaena sp. CCNP1317]WGS75451.1 hypothetical protein OA858_26175 [Pseudanabaena galeata CCNP1313]
MSDISGSSDTKIKQKTIAQAILEVMGETNRTMTCQEICQLIVEKNLYHFNTDDTQGMVYNALWKHSSKTKDHSSPNKYFYKDGNKWTLLEQNDSDNNESNLQTIDFEASLYDYLFDLEDLENN